MCLIPMNPDRIRSRTGAANTCIALNRPQRRPKTMLKKAKKYAWLGSIKLVTLNAK
jgi:hypothetical protein